MSKEKGTSGDSPVPLEGVTPSAMEGIKRELKDAAGDYAELGGWENLKSGTWVWQLIHKSFVNYWERANVEYFQQKYRTMDKHKIAAKLISVAARNAALLGAATGAAVSADEIVGVATAGEGGIGIPANIAVGLLAVGSEAILLARFQLQLVANLGKLLGVPLDPKDPEDILTILAFALGGSAADTAGKFGMKVGGRLAGNLAKGFFSKEVLATLKRVAAKVSIKILQKSVVKNIVPLASIGIGTGWNYVSTRAVGKIAIKHFEQRLADQGEPEPPAVPV